MLAVGEDEATDAPLTKAHIQAFDRMKKCRRYIEQHLAFQDDSDLDQDQDQDQDPEMTEQIFRERFRTHFKRKKRRKKIRKAPEVRTPTLGSLDL